MTASPEKVAPELQEYVRVLRSRKFEVGAVTVGIVVLTMFFTLRQTPVYEGLAQVWVKPQVNPSSTVSIPQQPNLDTERQAHHQCQDAVANLVRADRRRRDAGPLDDLG